MRPLVVRHPLLLLAAMLWATSSMATGVRQLRITLLAGECEPLGQRTPSSETPLRLAAVFEDLTRAPGGAAHVEQVSLRTPDFEAIELKRVDCPLPEPIEVTPGSYTCGYARVGVTSAPLPPGRYTIPGAGLVFEVVGGPPAPCPSEEAYRVLADKRREARERRAALERERLRRARLREEEERNRRPPVPSDAHWEDRRSKWGLVTSAGVVGSTSTYSSSENDQHSAFVGGLASFGVRHFTRFDSRSPLSELSERSDNTVEELVWCAPVLCWVAGMLLMPGQAVIGNEHGLDLRVGVGRDYRRDSTGTALSLALRPIAHVSRGSRFSTASTVGTLLPELGVLLSSGAEDALFIRWHVLPIDLRLGRHVALSWDGVTVGPLISFDGPTFYTVGTALTLQGLAISE